MIVDTMSLDEALHILKEDLPLCNTHIKYTQDELARKTRKFKNRERIWHNPREFKSKNGFNYVIQFFSDPITFPKETRLKCFYYCWFVLKNKIYIFLPVITNRSYGHIFLYKSHFIERYNERHLKEPTFSKLKVFREFLLHNLKCPKFASHTDEHPEGFIQITNDGLAFGDIVYNQELNCQVSVMNTFVSWEMIGPDQRQIAMEAKMVFNELGYDLAVPEEAFPPLFDNEKNAKFIKTSRIADSIECLKQFGFDDKTAPARFNGML